MSHNFHHFRIDLLTRQNQYRPNVYPQADNNDHLMKKIYQFYEKLKIAKIQEIVRFMGDFNLRQTEMQRSTGRYGLGHRNETSFNKPF